MDKQTVNINDLSAEQLEELLQRKRAEEQDAANKRREAYEALRADFATKIRDELQTAKKVMADFHKLVDDDTTAFYDIMKEYGQLRTDDQRGFTVQEGDFKIEVKGNLVKGFDERADVATKRLIKFLREWIKDRDKGEDDPMYQLAMTMIERNRKGQLDYKNISKLYALEGRFADPEYTAIMALFKESDTASGTAINFYFWERTELGVWRKIEPSFNRM